MFFQAVALKTGKAKSFRNRGTYEPMWIELERLLSLDVIR